MLKHSAVWDRRHTTRDGVDKAWARNFSWISKFILVDVKVYFSWIWKFIIVSVKVHFSWTWNLFLVGCGIRGEGMAFV